MRNEAFSWLITTSYLQNIFAKHFKRSYKAPLLFHLLLIAKRCAEDEVDAPNFRHTEKLLVKRDCQWNTLSKICLKASFEH